MNRGCLQYDYEKSCCVRFAPSFDSFCMLPRVGRAPINFRQDFLGLFVERFRLCTSHESFIISCEVIFSFI